MIYTIGRTDLYDKYFQELDVVEKAVGGSVFQTFQEAKNYLDTEDNLMLYSIYLVEADWDKDTQIIYEDVTWRSLIRPARLTKLE